MPSEVTDLNMSEAVWAQLPSVLARVIRLDLHAFNSESVRFKAYSGTQTLLISANTAQISEQLKIAGIDSEADLIKATPSLQTLNIYYDSPTPFSQGVDLLKLKSLTLTDSTAEYLLPILKAPSIETLSIIRLSLALKQQTIPFYLDKAKIHLLLPSLTRLDIPSIGTLNAHILDRLPNTITSLNISNVRVPEFEDEESEAPLVTLLEHSPLPHEKQDLRPIRVNLFVDMSEITSTESLKELMDISIHRGQEERSTASIQLNSNVTVTYYVMLPRTIEFYGSVVDKDGKVTDVIEFLKYVQKVYDSSSEPIIGLLPCTPLTALPIMHISISPLLQDHATEYLLQNAQYATQRPVLSSQPSASLHSARISSSSFERYETCAVGGTFDYMHTGHRILLSACVLLAKKKLIIGVTGEPLLVKKANKEYLQAFGTRKQNVTQFCLMQNPDLIVDAVELLEPAGPTAVDPNIDILIVSQETAAGIDSLNKIRAEKGFPVMKGLIVPLASSTASMKELSPDDAKASSTTIRLHQRKIDEESKNLAL